MTNNRINAIEGQAMPTITPAGPLFGFDALSLNLTEGDDRTTIKIYPDAANAQLREASLPAKYYLQPTTAAVAARQGGPGLDFSMAAVVRRVPATGELEYVNATGTLTTALALPTSSHDLALQQLTGQKHTVLGQRIRNLFDHTEGDPDPDLTTIPLLHSSASCTFVQPEGAAGPPRFSAQTNPVGSIGAQVHNSYLLTCGPDEAKAVASSLKSGGDFPLSADYVVTEQFSTGDATLNVAIDVDVDRLWEDFKSVVSIDGSVTASVASGVIARAVEGGTSLRLKISDGDSVVGASALLVWIGSCVDVKSAVIELVKAELFDVAAAGPANGAPWWNELFGQNRVTLKTVHQNGGIRLQEMLVLSGSICAERMVPTDFGGLLAAAKADITTYLTEIGA